MMMGGESESCNDVEAESSKVINPLLIKIKEEPVDTFTSNETNITHDIANSSKTPDGVPITIKQEDEHNDEANFVNIQDHLVGQHTMPPIPELKSHLYVPLNIPEPERLPKISSTTLSMPSFTQTTTNYRPLSSSPTSEPAVETLQPSCTTTVPIIVSNEMLSQSHHLTENVDDDKKLPVEEMTLFSSGTNEIDDIVKPELDIKEEYDDDGFEETKDFQQNLISEYSMDGSSSSATVAEDSSELCQDESDSSDEGEPPPKSTLNKNKKPGKRKIVHNPKSSFICKVCNFANNNTRHMKAHVDEVHTAECKFRCLLCKTKVVNHQSFNHLEHHVATVHRSKTRWQCKKCGKSFKSNPMLKKHKATQCYSMKPYACHLCTYTCITTRSLENHIASHSLLLVCPHCSKSLKKPNYKRHLIMHSGDSKYWCRTCEFKGYTNHELNQHYKKTGHDKPHLCPVCLNGFEKEPTMKKHMQTCNPKKISVFLCEYEGCTQVFNNPSFYKYHKKIHELPEDQIIRCASSDCTFITYKQDLLMKHYNKTLHHRRFYCSLCTHRFSKESSLEGHIKNIHSDNPNSEQQDYKTGYYMDDEEGEEVHGDNARIANFGMLWLGISDLEETNGEVEQQHSGGETTSNCDNVDNREIPSDQPPN